MFPLRLERDTGIVRWDDDMTGWCSASSNSYDRDYLVRSDGSSDNEWHTLQVSTTCAPTSARKIISNGVHLKGPEDVDELTLYEYHAIARSEDDDVRPVLFVGVSPASITNGAGGDTVSECRFEAISKSCGAGGADLEARGVVGLTKTDHVAADRNVCFAIGMQSGSAGSAAGTYAWAQLSVRRLIGQPKEVIDADKL